MNSEPINKYSHIDAIESDFKIFLQNKRINVREGGVRYGVLLILFYLAQDEVNFDNLHFLISDLCIPTTSNLQEALHKQYSIRSKVSEKLGRGSITPLRSLSSSIEELRTNGVTQDDLQKLLVTLFSFAGAVRINSNLLRELDDQIKRVTLASLEA